MEIINQEEEEALVPLVKELEAQDCKTLFQEQQHIMLLAVEECIGTVEVDTLVTLEVLE
jgi:hypothetical protein